MYYSTTYIGAGGCGGGEGDDTRSNYEGETGYGGSLPGQGGTISAGGAVTSSDGNEAIASNGYPGSFGKGGHFTGTQSVGMGGGGWFGGGSGSDGGRQGAGGGGSSFIYNSSNISAAGNIKDGKNYRQLLKVPQSGNYFTAADLEITPTILVTGGSPSLHGQARIVFKSAE